MTVTACASLVRGVPRLRWPYRPKAVGEQHCRARDRVNIRMWMSHGPVLDKSQHIELKMRTCPLTIKNDKRLRRRVAQDLAAIRT